MPEREAAEGGATDISAPLPLEVHSEQDVMTRRELQAERERDAEREHEQSRAPW